MVKREAKEEGRMGRENAQAGGKMPAPRPETGNHLSTHCDSSLRPGPLARAKVVREGQQDRGHQR